MTATTTATGVASRLDLVPCEVCMKEIPRSVARSAEADDYVVYFCGLECYEDWAAEQIRERTQEAGEP